MKKLSDFIVCESNKYSYAVAVAVIEEPGQGYNPLYIYGDPGRGKTHLLQGIALGISEKDPSECTEYIESKEFNQMSEDEKLEVLGKLPFVDSLIIDDIDEFDFVLGAGGEPEGGLQDLLMIAIESLVSQNKQVVLSGKCPLRDLPIENRIIRRINNYGFVADIQDVDLQTKTTILENLARESKIEVSDEIALVIKEIVDNSEGDIFQDKSKLNKYIGVSRLLGKEL